MSTRSLRQRIASAARRARGHAASSRMYCERHALATLRKRRGRPGGRILAYHTVGQREWGVNDVTPAQFRRHLELALRLGHRFVPPAEIAATGGRPMDLAVTFDDAARSVRLNAAPILRELGIPYAVFAVAEWAENAGEHDGGQLMNWRELGELMADGAEIGSHSLTHPDFAAISPDRYGPELAQSRRVIEARLGVAPAAFAIPFGQSANWPAAAATAAREAGYALIYAQAEDTRPPGTVARTFVTRFDNDQIFEALLGGVFDRWEEWY